MLRRLSVPKRILNSFTRQNGPSDCGAACMLSIIRYHGGNIALEQLKLWCGTNQQGTTMAGLKSAANNCGLVAQGLIATSARDLQEIAHPCIIHIRKDNGCFHYLVLYGLYGYNWLIGDPASGFSFLRNEQLEAIWASKALLKIEPGPTIIKKENGKLPHIKQLLRQDFHLLTAILVLGIIVGTLGLAQAFFTQQLIDILIPAKNLTPTLLTLSGLLLLLLIRAIVNYCRNRLMLTHHITFNKQLINEFLKKIHQIPLPYFKSKASAEILARINDGAKIQKVIQLLIGNFLVDILMTVLIVLGVLWYAPGIALGVAFIVGLFVIILMRYEQQITKAHQKVMAAYSGRERNLIETFDNIQEIRTHNASRDFLNRSQAAHNSYQDQILNLGFINLSCGFWSELMSALLIIFPMYAGAILLFQEKLQLGEWVALLFLISGILPALSRSVTFNSQLKEALVAFSRLHEIWELSPEDPTTE